jgi:hypothetical protein
VKLVETDAALPIDEDAREVPRPPRPEHRKAYVSLLLTTAVLAATVAVVYVLFPKRHNEVIEETIDYHREPGALEIEAPTSGELRAWTIGIHGRAVPWPEAPGLKIVGARRLRMLRKPAAMVRYDLGGDPITVVAMVPWDAPPRTIRRDDGGESAVWWRKGPWTFIAVGSAATAEAWQSSVGAP